jgi:hypothetical protein
MGSITQLFELFRIDGLARLVLAREDLADSDLAQCAGRIGRLGGLGLQAAQ